MRLTQDTRLFEVLAAASAQKTTRRPGRESFTSALIYALNRLVRQKDEPFTIDELLRIIKDQAPHFPKEQEPCLVERSYRLRKTNRIILYPIRQGWMECQSPIKYNVIQPTPDLQSIGSSRSPSVSSENARDEKASTLPSSFDRAPSFQFNVLPNILSDNADIQSVVSDGDEIGSLLSATRSPQALMAENHLALLLAKSDALSPLLDEALSKMGQDRFIKNLRRLLKRCYLDLLPHAKTNLEKATKDLLRRRRSRVRVARLIIDMRSPENHGIREQQFSIVQGKSKYLEDWIASNASLAPGPSLLRPLPAPPLPHREEEEEEEEDGEDLEGDLSSESNISDAEPKDEDQNIDLPNISQMENFLVGAQAFKNLEINLHIFLSPAAMKPIIRNLLPVPPDRISFSTKNNHSICNKMKILAEHVTENDWNWWPLQPKMRFLKEDETRVLWTCVSKYWAFITTLLSNL